MMTDEKFINRCEEAIMEYNGCLYKVCLVWFVKALQNYKALFTTFNGYYYEATYNGDKDELYLDVYKKETNLKFEDITYKH